MEEHECNWEFLKVNTCGVKMRWCILCGTIVISNEDTGEVQIKHTADALKKHKFQYLKGHE